MSTKYLAAIDTDERGFLFSADDGRNFSTRLMADEFTNFEEAEQAASDLRKLLDKNGYTCLQSYVYPVGYPYHYNVDIHPDTAPPYDAVHSPAHYQLADGLEAIDVIDQAVEDPASFYRGNAIKYLLRAGRKGDAHEDLRKARYYIDRELSNG
ncbi:DUF3310 domain-containing protein [Corynebacterium propinquum]|uniref:DUF3310 domain-containing protein n=1 Tax=Corynebacterium propinquum TaxID=43769 RepID=UPI003C9229FC